jgi:hypothetical protein
MISKQDFGTAVQFLFDELRVLCLRSDPNELAKLSGFAAELAEARSTACDPEASATQVLSASCGLVDEFVERSWDTVISQAYDTYVAVSKAQKPA